jgi:hypothetical protein
MTKEGVKSCKFEYDDIDLREPLKVTTADGSEKIWSLAKLPEDDDQEDANDPNATPGKPKLVMVAIPKVFPFAYEDDPPMGSFGHKDVETAPQSVDGKLLIIIRALTFLAEHNDGNSYHKITNFAWNYFPVLKQKFEKLTSKSIYTKLESLQPDVPDHKIMEMQMTNAQILLQAKHQMKHPQVVIIPPAQSTNAPIEDSSSFVKAARILAGKDDEEEESIKMTANCFYKILTMTGSLSNTGLVHCETSHKLLPVWASTFKSKNNTSTKKLNKLFCNFMEKYI